MREELAVLDDGSGEIRTGLDGLLWWAGSTRLSILARAARPFRPLLAPLYRFVAVNRRFLAPPPESPEKCACEPEPRPVWNLAFVAVAGGLSLLFSAAFGWALTRTTLGTARPMTVGGAMLATTLLGLSFALLPSPEAGRLRAAAHAAGALLAGSWILGLAAAVGLAGLRPWGLLVVVAAIWLAARSWNRRATHLLHASG